MKRDIQNRDDIELLINKFYQKLLDDEELAPIFENVAGLHLNDHLKIIIDFWESVLFQTGNYNGNTMQVHLNLHQKYGLKEDHFKRWLNTFNNTLDELFVGEKANEAKERALSIAAIIKMKIDHLEQNRTG